MLETPLLPVVIQLQDEIEYGDNGMVRKHLVKDKKRQAMLICLQSGIQIPEHTSSYNAFIIVIQGGGIFWLNGREIRLETGTFIDLPAETLHGLTVTEDLAMLKVIDSHELKKTSLGSRHAACQESSLKNREKQTTCAESLVEILKPYLQSSGLLESTVPNLCQHSAHECSD